MKRLLALLLTQAAFAQYELQQEDSLDALTTPLHGEQCGYASCMPIKQGWLNVHLVPQTHSELGHGYNFHQHFTGEDPPFPKNAINMKRILDSILTELWKDDHRRFTLSDTAYLFHWWKNRHPSVHRMMYELVRQGRLTIVGGGLGVTDEASTSYHAIIDQFTYSLRKLNATFRACARPLVAWAADVYGHSREFTSLMAQMGYDALFINPISYDEELARMRRKALEFLWRGSDDLGPASDLFTHNLFDGYWAPPGFCFSKLCTDPLLVTSSRAFSDVRERVDKFIEGVLYRQAPNYETRNVMVIMGHRKAYADADVWFANIEKLIAFTNWRANQKRLNITLFYSNPPCYLAAVHDERPELETKQDDFFPYVHDKDSYTVGMFSSRPTFKYLIREAHIYLQIAKQLQVSANLGPYAQLFDDFNWVMGVVQDHSVAPGVLRQRVKDYYTFKLDAAINNATGLISKAITKLRSSSRHVEYLRCQFNISSCYGSRFIKYTIQLYNPLGWPVTMPVRLPVYPTSSKFVVYNNDGEEVKSEMIKLPDTILRIKGRPKADHEIVFIATNIPPVGFRSYYIEAKFYKGKVFTRKDKDIDYDTVDKTAQSLWKDTRSFRTGRSKYEMGVLGLRKVRRENKRTVENGTDVKNISSVTNHRKTADIVKRTANDYLRNNISFIEVDDENDVETTTEGEIKLPMLRDFLRKSKVLHKIDFVDHEKDLLSSNELDAYESNTENESEATDTTDVDIKIPFTRNVSIPGTDIRIPFTRNKPISDIMVDPDIRVPIKRPKIKESDIEITFRMKPKESYPPFTTTTESDIRVFTPARRNPDIKIVVDADIKVPVKKVKANTNERKFAPVYEETTTESLSIVPVRTSTATTTMNAHTIATTEGSSTESVLGVVPVRKTWEEYLKTKDLKLDTKRRASKIKDIEEFVSTTEAMDVKTAQTEIRRFTEVRQVYKPEGDSDIDTDSIVEPGAQNGDIEQIENFEKFRAETQTTEETVTITDAVVTTENTDTFSTTESSFSTTEDDQMLAVSPMATRPVSTTEATNSKYFSVDDGSKLFIGNKYVRVNLDKKRRITSLFLRNGVRINLDILMFHYVSDDPSKFDIRTVPRRDIKPPGAYIFRPIDPYIVRAEDNYDVRIVKTDVVEEIHITFSNWTSLVMRLYVDSPVVEVHWLVGPIPTEDGLGKDVFIRYKTDLDHEGAFYTDSNGRQTIKRIRGARATYDPVDLDPITGNIYPVTSKIYIEDKKKNIRFAVFNDRCQAGGVLIDGAIDLMVHRRILTDDIGFGAFLNETENGEPIRAAGVHYLYLTKANRNRIFEKKFAKEIALQPRVLTSHHLLYTESLRKEFADSKNEFSALKDKLPIGVHLLSLERISPGELLVRLENYLEKVDVISDGVRYVPLRSLFKDIKVMLLKETTLAGNLYKDQWTPTQWRKKNKFYRRFNDYYGGGNVTLEENVESVNDELGGRGVRLAPQEIRTFIVKYEYLLKE